MSRPVSPFPELSGRTGRGVSAVVNAAPIITRIPALMRVLAAFAAALALVPIAASPAAATSLLETFHFSQGGYTNLGNLDRLPGIPVAFLPGAVGTLAGNFSAIVDGSGQITTAQVTQFSEQFSFVSDQGGVVLPTLTFDAPQHLPLLPLFPLSGLYFGLSYIPGANGSLSFTSPFYNEEVCVGAVATINLFCQRNQLRAGIPANGYLAGGYSLELPAVTLVSSVPIDVTTAPLPPPAAASEPETMALLGVGLLGLGLSTRRRQAC